MNAPKFAPWTIEGERLINSKLVVITQRESDGRDYPVVFTSRDAAPLARSAPELYEALDRVTRQLAHEHPNDEAWVQARAALAKAVTP